MIEDFCTNLINYRQKAQLTRKEVADKLGISEIAYGAYERGKRLPDIEKLCILSHLFEVTPNDLLNFYDGFATAKRIWRKYGFTVKKNKDESISLSKLTKPSELNDKIAMVDGKIKFGHKFLIKEILFFNVESFIEFTEEIVNDFETSEVFHLHFDKMATERTMDFSLPVINFDDDDE